jgi:hypothetical protein
MFDLTKFNLKKHNFYMHVRKVTVDPFNQNNTHAKVVIFNFTDETAFELPNNFTLDEAHEVQANIIKNPIVNLIDWDTSDYLTHITKDDLFSCRIDPHCFGNPEQPPEPTEDDIHDEDGDIAYGEMLEKQAQDFANIDKEYFGNHY